METRYRKKEKSMKLNECIDKLNEEREKSKIARGKMLYYKKVIMDSNDAVIIQDFKGKIRAWNKRAEKIYGFKAKEMIGKSILKIIAKKDRASARKNIKAVRGGKPTFRSFQIRKTKDEREISILITYSPIYEEEELIEIATTEQDATRGSKLVENLKNSEIRYRRLFESAKDSILILDAKSGKIIDSNPFLQELLGYSANWLIGKRVWQISPFRDIIGNKKKLKELQKKKYVRYENLPLESKSGVKKYVEFVANVYPVGDVDIIQCNIRDISERKKVQDELKKLNDELEQRVEERTSELKNANEELKEIDILKTDFINMISHELKTPLTAISAHLEILLEKDFSIMGGEGRAVSKKITKDKKNNKDKKESMNEVENPAQRSLNAIERSSYQLKTLITNLLEVSRIQSRTLSLNIEKVDAIKVVQEVIEDLEILAKQTGVEIKISLCKLPKISVDRDRLTEIFNNLIMNAIKFTDKGYIKITCKRDGDFVFFSIADTGIGMKKTKISHLFEKFYQIGGAMSHKFAGSGLGLPITKQLLELQGGSISVKTTYGKGSTFTVKLPIGYKKSKEYIALGKEVKNQREVSSAIAVKKGDEKREILTPMEKESAIVKKLFRESGAHDV